MRFLLDTHALAWWVFDDPRLTMRMRQQLGGPDNAVFVSAVSAFECAAKFRIGKWPEAAPLVHGFDELVGNEGFDLLSLSSRHALRAGLIVSDHRDPFDRMIAAQADVEGLALVSIDPVFRQMGVATIW